MAATLLTNKRTVIIGGGPVGLACARLLQLRGVAVTVYERDAHAAARPGGSTLDLHRKTGQRTLQQAGLLAAFRAHARPVGLQLSDKQGRLLFRMDPDKTRPEIDRQALRQLLLDSLAPGTVVWDRQVVALDQQAAGCTLHFQNGESVAADFVIIADGVQSKIRNLVFGTLPEETGTFVIQGEIANYAAACPTLARLTGPDNLAVVEDKKTLFTHQRSDGSVCLYASFRRTEPGLGTGPLDFQDPAAVRQLLSRLFVGHAAVYHELFDAVHTFSGFPIRVFPAAEIERPHAHLTLVGDAAHAMPPFGGTGVNLGLVDALTLTRNLTSGKFASLAAAVADYERQMVAYAQPLQRGTHVADDQVHTQYANVVQRMKKTKVLQVGRVVQYLALVLASLLSGVLSSKWLTSSLLAPAATTTWRSLVPIGPAGGWAGLLAGASVLLMGASAYFLALAQARSQAFYAALAASGLLLLAVGSTWVADNSLPTQVAPLFAGLRLGAVLVSFGLFAAAVVRPLARLQPE